MVVCGLPLPVAEKGKAQRRRNYAKCEVLQTSRARLISRVSGVAARREIYQIKSFKFNNICRGVAQFGRALRSGRRGRGFKSRHLDQSRASTRKRVLRFLSF